MLLVKLYPSVVVLSLLLVVTCWSFVMLESPCNTVDNSNDNTLPVVGKVSVDGGFVGKTVVTSGVAERLEEVTRDVVVVGSAREPSLEESVVGWAAIIFTTRKWADDCFT